MSAPKVKIYHYAPLRDWKDIQTGDSFLNIPTGLQPQRNIGQDDPEAWKTRSLFGLLKPQPDNWVSNPDFPDIWSHLRKGLGSLLLEINVDLNDPTVFVADRGHIQGHLDVDNPNIPKRYLHPIRGEGERQYMLSKIPLQEYLDKTDDLQFSLPEVLITRDVPLEEIGVSIHQPLLEQRLAHWPDGGLLKRESIAIIENTPELYPWYAGYQQREVQQDRGVILRERA